jgi:hypothetical protein
MLLNELVIRKIIIQWSCPKRNADRFADADRLTEKHLFGQPLFFLIKNKMNI